ncbi:MAG: hypothetical protein QXW43_04930 [Candidatus Methanomethyliaceae archaeon]
MLTRPIALNDDDVLRFVAHKREIGQLGGLFSTVVSLRGFFRYLNASDQLDSQTYQKFMQTLETRGLKQAPKLICLEKEEFDKFQSTFLSMFEDEYYKKIVRCYELDKSDYRYKDRRPRTM